MTTDLDTLLTAMYVHVDDRLTTPRWRGRPPRPTDAQLVTLAVAQAVPGFHCEARWMRLAHAHLHGMFPYLPQRPACDKRLPTALPLVKRATRSPAADTDLRLDDVWTVDSPPAECARSRETVKRSDPAGWANYGYCRSHSHSYWGLKLHLVRTHLVCTLKGQLDPEQHGGRTIEGVGVRVAQRILAVTCAIWHNRTIGAPITRSLIAYDH
ncbi:hypothetical protein [Streptomyces scabiei]|uniref:hypothetical protein n=1 Tax=Streptomyces scabiei TaxID=1930 RepID=UPI0029B47B81|nr:hypothetical protein [Streptomyces scabiei]MDX3118142.1 hypothetical protein [Streptomyces scabiei]